MTNRKRGRNTRGTNMPEVPAGAIKAIPKRGESTEAAIARVQAAHPGKTVVDPPRGGSRSGYGNRSPISNPGEGRKPEIVGPLGVGTRPVRLPIPIPHSTYTGRVATSQILRDQYMASRPSVYITAYDFFSLVEGPITTSWFQHGSVNGDAAVSNVLGGAIQQTFNNVAREYMATKGRNWPTFLLGNGGTGAQFLFSIAAYLAAFIDAFLQLRTLEGALNLGDFNNVTQLIAGACEQRLPQIMAAMDRLRLVSVPQKLVDCLDHLCGPKAIDPDSPVVFANGFSSSIGLTPLDLSVVANLDSYLTNINNQLTLIQTGGPSLYTGISAGDLASIGQLFALCYGFPKYPTKTLSYDEGEWALIINSVYTATQSTGHLATSFPNINDTNFTGVGNSGVVVPILHPKGVDNDATKLLYTLFRNGAYSVDPIAGVTSTANRASQVGLLANQLQAGDHGTQWGEYNQAGGFLAVDAVGAALVPPTYQTGGAQLELYPWSGEANSGLNGPIGVDTRFFHDYDRIYVSPNWFLEETVNLWEHMFLDF